MKLLIATLLIALSSTAALADNSCLSQVSNDDLIRELSNRLGQPSQPSSPSSAMMTFTCASNMYGLPTLNLAILPLPSGTEVSASMNVTSADDCAQLRATLTRSKTTIYQPIVVAVSATSMYGLPTVNRIMIKPSGESQTLSSLTVSSAAEALATARDIDGGR